MDEKAIGSRSVSDRFRHIPTHCRWYDRNQTRGRSHFFTRCLFIVLTVFAILLYIKPLPPNLRESVSHVQNLSHSPRVPLPPSVSEVDETVKKVPLEAHIMSKCPDARDCLRQLVVPAMVEISDKVDFRLSYIGRYTNHSDAVECKHGESECLGNMILLCAALEYPEPILYLGFANCMIGKYRQIPGKELVQDCALEHGIDFDKINKCISSEGKGVELLRESFQRSEEAGVERSCTVRLNEQVRCIRDGGEWKDCKNGSDVNDLIRDIDVLYKKWNGDE